MTTGKERAARPAPGPTPVGKGDAKEIALPDLPEIPTVALAGRFAEDVTLVPASYSSLVLSSGHLEEEDQFVLLPFIEINMKGIRQGDAPSGEASSNLETIFAHTLPLENALWLTFDLLHDFTRSCERLNDMVEGNLRFDKSRMIHAIKFAELAANEATRCAEVLKALNDEEASPRVK